MPVLILFQKWSSSKLAVRKVLCPTREGLDENQGARTALEKFVLCLRVAIQCMEFHLSQRGHCQYARPKSQLVLPPLPQVRSGGSLGERGGSTVEGESLPDGIMVRLGWEGRGRPIVKDGVMKDGVTYEY